MCHLSSVSLKTFMSFGFIGRDNRHVMLLKKLGHFIDVNKYLHNDMPRILGPSRLDGGDGRRPDGITTFPWEHGNCLVRDATVIDAFSKSHIIASSIESGSAAKTAEILKSRKYQSLVGNFHFQLVAYETTGCCGPSTGSFVEKLGKKVIEATGDPLEAIWLRQKVSAAMLPAFFSASAVVSF